MVGAQPVIKDRSYRQRLEARFPLLLAALSLAALLSYYAKQQLLLYGDAVAHINIARRIVDNRHPMLALQYLGTVWLPLQHIAMLPFVWSDGLWRSGVAGAIPGMVAYVLGTLAVFRLVSAHASQLAAYAAAAIYALNPNLLYLQTTAMNEPIFLALFLWTLVYLDEFARAVGAFGELHGQQIPRGLTPARDDKRGGWPDRQSQQSLELCGITLAGAAFTRYDGWFIAPIILLIVLAMFARGWRRTFGVRQRRRTAKSLVEVLLLNALVPVFWLVQTRSASGKALDFLNGPYSAKAIAVRSGTIQYPGKDHLLTAALYFLKSAKLNVGAGWWSEALFALAVAGTALAILRFRRRWTLLLLWLPFVFYTLSVAYGSVPIYIPVWWPFSYYNVRYGLELLPVFCVFPALLAGWAADRANTSPMQLVLWAALAVAIAGCYVSVWLQSPITLREAEVNSRSRIALEEGLAAKLSALPQPATLLMYEAEHVGALQRAGIPLRGVISEAEHPNWEWALLDPARYADFMIGCQGDPVWAATRQHRTDVRELVTISAPGQAPCAIYERR